MHRKFVALAVASIFSSGAVSAATLVDGSTLGLYNNGIGTVLNGTDPFFVNPGVEDPTMSISTAPDISAAAADLGDWLTNPSAPGGDWAGPTAIPSTWTVESETAIIYEIDGGTTGFDNVVANIGVDNGVLVWLNGIFIGGEQAPGGANINEYNFALGSVSAGTNYLQILREDHGGSTGWAIEVVGDVASPDAVPLPAGAALLLTGMAGFLGLRGRKT